MKKLSEVYKELGIAFTFPIEIKDSNGEETYFETSDGYWHLKEYNRNNQVTYREDNDGYWCRYVYDENGNETYYENSYGTKRGTKRKSCDGKVIEVDGKKYKLIEQ